MNYLLIGEKLAIAGKDMTKLNNRLDKVLEKLAEYECVAESKAKASQLIEDEDYEAAITLVKTLAKGAEKHASLNAEEADLRKQLEELRLKSEAIASGDVSIDLSVSGDEGSETTKQEITNSVVTDIEKSNAA